MRQSDIRATIAVVRAKIDRGELLSRAEAESLLRLYDALDPAICPTHGVAMHCPGCIGAITSKAKAKASAANGLKGGRPHHLRGGRPRKQGGEK